MRYLLDTHIFIWWLNGDKRLRSSVKEKIKNTNNRFYVSVASALEMSIKSISGKIKLKTTIKRSFEISGFEVLNINLSHAIQLGKLPFYHKDPFDRMLIAQAKIEKCTLITDDSKIKRYNVSTL